jgi:multiple sugar transport system permease protein
MSIETRTRRVAAAFLAPASLALALVTLLPTLWVIWMSLERRAIIDGAPRFIGLANYARLAHDARFWNALGNTIYFTVVSVALELALGLAVALLLVRAGRARTALYAVVLVPWAVPTIVSARMWEWIYNADFGVLNYLLGRQFNWLGSPVLAMHAAILMDVWKATPFVALLLLAGLQAIPRDLYLAAAVDGMRPFRIFLELTLPLLAPVIAVVLIFRTIDAFRVFDAIYVLTGGGPANATETISIYAYKVLFQTLEFGYGSALSVVVMLTVGLAAVLYVRLLRGAS